jgi:UDP-glucose 4-epimerase|tara:strand:+ start:1263 stop:2162 length:900 start_codon:yes stop_codon:yes gene_type:complete
MKILVTGAAGFIGTNLIKRLIKEGHEVHGLDDFSTGYRENKVKDVPYIEQDVSDLKYWGEDEGYKKLYEGLGNTRLSNDYNLIYHLAGLSRIQPSFNNPDETFKVNTIGTQKVCEYARIIGAKVVYAGSSSKWHNPYQSPYSTCKYLGEEICKMYKLTYGMDIEIARFYNVYGPYEVIDGDWAAVIGIWRRQVRDGEEITIVGDGEQRRDFTHVDDIVDGLWRIGMKNKKHEDAWELGTGNNYSINEVYQMFKNKFNVNCTYLPDQKGNYRVTLRERDDALGLLGWQPKDRLKEYIQSL